MLRFVELSPGVSSPSLSPHFEPLPPTPAHILTCKHFSAGNAPTDDGVGTEREINTSFANHIVKTMHPDEPNATIMGTSAAAANGSDDDDSSSCSSDSSEFIFPEGTTEEEAVAIWERRSEVRVERRERLRQREERARLGIVDPPRDPTENIMGEYDPRYHDAWMACERYANMNRPGISENYVPSTPGMALLLEQTRQQKAKVRYEEEMKRRQQEESARQQLELLYAEQRRIAQGGKVPSPTTIGGLLPCVASINSNASTSLYQSALADQVREYERLRRSAQDARSEDDKKPPPTKKGPVTQRYYLATSYATQAQTKPVSCNFCSASMYTNQVADRYFCQKCGHISECCDDEDARWEGKMQDAEDMDMS